MNNDLSAKVKTLLYPPDQLAVKPIGSLLPVNYHIIPEHLRLMVLRYLSKKKNVLFDNTLSNHPFEDIWRTLNDEDKKSVYTKFQPMEFGQPFIVLTHDVDSVTAMDNILRLAEIEQSFNFHSSWNFIAFRYKWNDVIWRTLMEAGNEIGLHGFYHDNKLHLRKEEEIKNLFSKIASKIEKYNIKGGRIPSWFVDNRLLKIFENYFTYDTSMMDEPIHDKFIPGGCGSVRPYRIGNMIEIPTNINFGKTYTYNRFDLKPHEHWTKKALKIAEARGLAVSMTHPNKCHLYGAERLGEYKQFLQNLHDHGFKSILPSEVVELMNKEIKK